VVIAAKISSAPSTAAGQTATSVLGTSSASAGNSVATPRFYLTGSPAGTVPSSLTNGVSKGANDAANLAAYIGGSNSSTAAGAITSMGSFAADYAAAAAIVRDQTEGSSTVTAYLVLTPDVAGTYSVLLSTTTGKSTVNPSYSFEAGVGVSTTASVSTGGAPTTITLTNISGTTNIAGTYGVLLKVTLNGQLTGDEAVNVTASAGYVAGATATGGAFQSVPPTSSTTARLTKSNFINGVAFVNWEGSAAAQTATVTATGTGSLAAITANVNAATATATADLTATKFAGRGGTGVTTGWSLTTATATGTTVNIKSTATSSTLEFTHADVADATTAYGCLYVEDDGGAISGAGTVGNDLKFEKSWTKTGTSATTDTYSSVSLTHAALGTTASATGGYKFDDCFGSTITEFTVVGATSSSASGSVTVTPSNARVASGGSIALTALVKDQFGLAMAGESVTTTVAGRNGARASEVQTTSSTGYVTSTITDAGTAASAATDTVTFTASTGSKTGSSQLTWGTYTVGTVTMVTGSNQHRLSYYR